MAERLFQKCSLREGRRIGCIAVWVQEVRSSKKGIIPRSRYFQTERNSAWEQFNHAMPHCGQKSVSNWAVCIRDKFRRCTKIQAIESCGRLDTTCHDHSGPAVQIGRASCRERV